MTRLLVISNMMHHWRDGRLVGHGPTAREVSYLAQLFDEVRHIGCLHSDMPSLMELPYEGEHIALVPLPPAGGERIIDKLQILRHTFLYMRTIYRELAAADVVHVRCPANIPLLAIIILALCRHPRIRWIKYAGNWKPTESEPWSYSFQRWWLRHNLCRARVTVNGRWDDLPVHTSNFFNPCLTDEELVDGAMVAQSKSMASPIRLLFVGNLSAAKGLPRLLQIAYQLQQLGAEFQLRIIGDGCERPQYEQETQRLGLTPAIAFLGALPRQVLNDHYAWAHFIILPTDGEGWPKVLSEAMAYGVVPLASAVSSIPQYLDQFQTGRAIPLESSSPYVDAILGYSQQPGQWKKEALNGLSAVKVFTYSHYLSSVKSLLGVS